jgi:hypothetical protein
VIGKIMQVPAGFKVVEDKKAPKGRRIVKEDAPKIPLKKAPAKKKPAAKK